MNRRSFLFHGSIFGLTLPEILKAQNDNNPKAKSIIHIYLPGGISHQESFDPKPFAPVEYKGPLNYIKTNVDGIILGEHFKETSKIADKIAIINSMTHGEAAHERGTHNMFTGYKPSPAVQYPSFGSVISHDLGIRNNIPAYIAVPNKPNEFAGSGYLSNQYGPFSLGAEPSDPNFKVKDLTSSISPEQLSRRKSILELVNSKFENSIKDDNVSSLETFYRQAYNLMDSQSAKDAFEISKESQNVREMYGMGEAGSRFLLARRLVEAGSRMVTVVYGSWDHHDNIKANYERQAPEFDKAYAALIKDLHDRGLLNSTLVVVSSEFGRTPKINNTNGRDHWPRVFSTVLAGGGIVGGQKYGKSDALGAEVDENPVTPADLAMTIYNALGINGKKQLMTAGSRPVDIVKDGKILPLT